MSAMTNTNWPDPTRPGVPMFPERDGWHAIGLTIKQVKWWDATNKYWWDSERRYYLTLDEVAFRVPGYGYIGPVLNPAQINEMLAAERERICLMIERSLDASCSLLPTAGKTLLKAATEDITDAIRNLGDAP